MNQNLKSKFLLTVLLVSFGVCTSAFANPDNKPTAKTDNAPTEYKDTTGVSIEYDSSGSGNWMRIRALGDATCVICDHRDINVATRKAELRAKASIAKFLKEKIATSEVMEETVKTMTEHNGQSETVNRKTLETQVETIQNSADAILKGVLVLEQKSDPAGKFVSVTVGISRKTMATADSVNRTLNTDQSSPVTQGSGANSSPEAQTRRNKSYSDF